MAETIIGFETTPTGTSMETEELPVLTPTERRSQPGRCPTRLKRLEYADRYAAKYPYLACLPLGDARPEDLETDMVIGGTFAYVPFAGPGELGWTAWFFPTQTLRDLFVRRFRRARPMRRVGYVSGYRRPVQCLTH